MMPLSENTFGEKERASWNKGAKVLRHDFRLIQLLKAGCAALSRPLRS
jgi:hypothetical protein